MESPRLASIPDAGRALCSGRSTVYKLLDSGDLEAVKIGARRLVLRASIDAYIDRLASGGTSAGAA